MVGNRTTFGLHLRATMTKPPANVLDLQLDERAEMTLKAAVEKVIVKHAPRGRPICIWRDGTVAKAPTDEFRAESALMHTEST
jgi:hypothetical protein